MGHQPLQAAERAERLRVEAAAKELQAAQLGEEARVKAEHSHMLERDAGRRVEQVQRVLADASLSQNEVSAGVAASRHGTAGCTCMPSHDCLHSSI